MSMTVIYTIYTSFEHFPYHKTNIHISEQCSQQISLPNQDTCQMVQADSPELINLIKQAKICSHKNQIF